MEHLCIPSSVGPVEMRVPHLNLAPKYDRKGFQGFPERHSMKSDELIHATQKSLADPKSNPKRMTSEYVESFLQEWLWFGALHEFEIVCGVPMDMRSCLRNDALTGSKVLNTEFLLPYVRSVVIKELGKKGVNLGLRVGDLVKVKLPLGMLYPGATVSYVPVEGPYKIVKDLGNLTYQLSGGRTKDPQKTYRALELGKEGEKTPNVDANTGDLPAIRLRTLVDQLRHLQILTTSALPSFEESESRIARCLREIRRSTVLALTDQDPCMRLQISFAIDMLCESLSEVMYTIFGETVCLDKASSIYLVDISGWMKQANWCPARVETLLTDKLIPMYWTAVLRSNESHSHNECGVTSCKFRAKDVSQLFAQHSSRYCNGSCPMIEVPERKLIDILKAGGIPGISSVLVNNNGKFSYDVVDVRGRPFVAISHVWAHGLGNPTINALPLCQILVLFKQIQTISPINVVLWIDTLTVPIDLEYKRIAIMRLREVYLNAGRVLVVDKHLQQVGGHWLEQRLQLLASEWMRRLWTLQEGRLAEDRLYIQYKNRAVSILELMDGTTEHKERFDAFVFTDLQATSVVELRRLFGQREDVSQRFLDLVDDLSTRSATVASDEPICIATLLGLSLEKFHPFPTMADIYRSVSPLPDNLMFRPGPRVSERGLRWAPATFLEQGPTFSKRSEECAEVTEQGIRVCKDAVIFDQAIQFEEDMFMNSDFTPDDAPRMHVVTQNGKKVCTFRQIGLQSSPRIYKANGIVLRDAHGLKPSTPGVLVTMIEEVKGITYCKFQRNVQVWNWNEHTSLELEMALSLNRTEGYVVQGHFRSREVFCVD